jgi:hypothetical protein
MNPNAPTIILSPLIDADGVPLQGLAGEPLAADEQGVVYTLRDDALPEVLGELAPDDHGRMILVPLNGLGATAGERSARVQAARCRQAMARSRRRHHERRVKRLTARITNGQARGTLTPNRVARLEREKQQAMAKLEQAKAKEASATQALTTATALPLSGMDGDGMADDGDLDGLGRFRIKRKFFKRAALMAATGGAAAPFVAASRTRRGRRAFGGALNDDGAGDDAMAGAEMPVATQVGGLGEVGSWWTKNREKILGFGAGAASAALVASGATKGTGLNTLVTKGWDVAKGFFVPPSQGGSPAPGPMPAAIPMRAPAPMPVAAPSFATVRTAAASLGPAMVPAGIGGLDGKTLLLLGGLGLGALVLLRPARG